MARSFSGKRLLLGLLAVFCAAVIPAIVGPTLVCRQEDPKLEHYDTVPPFRLVDAQGFPFTEEALRDHPTVVDFVFTRCDTICPVLSQKLQRIEERTRDKRAVSIKFLSISVDPAYDTPARLLAFAQRYDANPERWKFVTGEPAAVKALVEGPFMNSMAVEGVTARGAPQISHSGYFLLVDGNLEIRGIYDSNDQQALDRLMRDARFLARTTRVGYKFGGT